MAVTMAMGFVSPTGFVVAFAAVSVPFAPITVGNGVDPGTCAAVRK
jgi:hypothetical protein